MIELSNDALHFSFPEVHPEARLTIDLQRTLRIPDDDRTYPLPPGLGSFPLRHIDDHADRAPAAWIERGGLLLPIYQSEALWLNFDSEFVDDRGSYPFTVKIAAGKVNAVTGEPWEDGLHRDPQDYLVAPTQPWLDGYAVSKGVIRQFVAMPLGSGYSAEEQLTGEGQWGGIQIEVHPMKREIFERRFPKINMDSARFLCRGEAPLGEVCYSAPDMGLAPGGRMEQEIHADPFDFADWDLRHRSRCFLALANSLVWRQITGEHPPTTPPTAKEYEAAGLPWFQHYSDAAALDGSKKLDGLKSVVTLGKQKGEMPLPENESVEPGDPIQIGVERHPGQVREW